MSRKMRKKWVHRGLEALTMSGGRAVVLSLGSELSSGSGSVGGQECDFEGAAGGAGM